MTGDRKRPKRDVSARDAIGECDHCGGNAVSTLDGEHLWTCSEIVPSAALEQYIDDLRDDSDRPDEEFDAATAETIADELEALLQQTEETR